ncbi:MULTISPECIES: ATP-binding protein [unclassified Aureimonas]|uniref:ATP-binding protein n=1 Tax=unclassified Aureimonas TaxID=2615206 RepID=UPI0006FC376D|nr:MULTISPECIES: ATP-binding protein [unclassified Aureimonas]KQT62589.1 hypothetical protein ASG62_23020 [Aureimonas sp. Leaf427]KQT73186.1 hypothetical protein ASG54_18015 [Aureimonas sp. Leaf460]
MRNRLGLFYLVMEHDPNLVFVKDPDGLIIYANRAFLELYPPSTRNSIVGTTTVNAFTPEEAAVWMAEDHRAMTAGVSEIVEEIFDYTGRRRFLLTRKIAFSSAEGEPRLLGISTDISELAERERSLVDANDRLAKFAAFAAHDLRSPLASIASAVNVVRQDRETVLGPRAEHVMELVSECARGLAQQVTTLLVSTHAEHRNELNRRLTDLNLLVEEVRFNLSCMIERHGASFHAMRLPSLVVEPDLFRQLLQNLVENAIRHRSDDRPPVIVFRHEVGGNQDVISVEDNGVGISPAEADRVFGAFEQGANALGGTGIGLALCRRVIGLHGGSMSIDTSYTEGCWVVLNVPRGADGVGRDGIRAA